MFYFPRTPTTKLGRISQRIDLELDAQLKAAAKRLGVPRSYLVRAALSQYLNSLKAQEPAPH
jgi:predicted DNA-binding protein